MTVLCIPSNYDEFKDDLWKMQASLARYAVFGLEKYRWVDLYTSVRFLASDCLGDVYFASIGIL